MSKMLTKDPELRISVEDALKHPWFSLTFDENVELQGFKENIEIV